MCYAWDIKDGDDIEVEAVMDERSYEWTGKLRIIQYRTLQSAQWRVIINIVEFWSHSTESILNELGIEAKHITKGYATLSMVRFPDVDYLFSVTPDNADYVTVNHSAVDISDSWFVAKNIKAVMYHLGSEIQITPWFVRKDSSESNFNCIDRLVALVKENTDADTYQYIKVGCPEDKSFYFAWIDK
ncbi:hypothetical protein [Pseudomonas phage vB_Pa-PAC2]